MNRKISIVVPVRNEINHIDECVKSLLEMNYDKDCVEIMLVDGMSDDGTTNVLKNYSKKYSFIKVINNEKKTTQFAMNLGIKASSGDYLFVLGSHAKYPKDYFTRLVSEAEKLGADCVGGIIKTEVKVKNKVSEAIKIVLSDIFGVGNSTFRIGVSEVKEVDTVPFGCYRSDVFTRYGLFNENLVRNQDIEFNKRIRAKGAKIFIVPEVSSVYYARDNFVDIAKNSYANGLWNILTVYYTKTLKTLSVRHFVPLVFVSAVLLLVLLSFFSRYFLHLFIIALTLYFLTIVLRSFYLYKKTLIPWVNICFAFFILHWSRGFGQLTGVVKVLLLRLHRLSSKKN